MKREVATHTLGFDLTKLKLILTMYGESCWKTFVLSDIMLSLRNARMKLGIPEGENVDDYNLLSNLFLPPTFVLKLQAALNRAYE